MMLTQSMTPTRILDSFNPSPPLNRNNNPTSNANVTRIGIARNRAEREKIYQFANKVYAGKGYIEAEDATAQNRIGSRFDAHPDTLMVFAEDQWEKVFGTVTLVFDSAAGLPCDEAFVGKLDALRKNGRRIAEVTRLALVPGQKRSRAILVGLFNLIYIAAYRNMECTDFIIEVNPRHAEYYRRLLGFEILTEPQPCPRVQNQPAVLLRLNLINAEQEVSRCLNAGTSPTGKNKGPSIYHDLLPPTQENEIAAKLKSIEK